MHKTLSSVGRSFHRAARLTLAAVACLGGVGLAQSARTIHIGAQAGGTLSWTLFAINYFHIDRDLGLTVAAQTYASKDATRVALRSGDAQVVVDDFLEASLLRAKGFDVSAVYPFSLITGGVLVPSDSPVQTVADLTGKTIGATSLTDKTLLMLRAYVRLKQRVDPMTSSKLIAASSPLMGQLLDRHQLDAAIPLWHHGARLLSTGHYRTLISTADLLKGLGLPANVPLLYVVARNDTDPEALKLFVKAVQLANERMKGDDGKFWNALLDQNLYALPDRTQLPALRKQWAAGLPKGWSARDLNNTVLLTQRMIEVAGPDVVGLQRLDARVFDTRFRP